MELHLKIIGILLMLLAFIHIPFPRYFKWKTELRTLSLINRQMMTTHTFFIALTVFLMGLLCFTSGEELIQTPLGRKISLGLGIFWVIRFFFQQFIYSSQLWRGKTFETIMHVVFSLLWIYLGFIFLKLFFIPVS
jgi:hypothetical protein